jgi:hypothetical protein
MCMLKNLCKLYVEMKILIANIEIRTDTGTRLCHSDRAYLFISRCQKPGAVHQTILRTLRTV